MTRCLLLLAACLLSPAPLVRPSPPDGAFSRVETFVRTRQRDAPAEALTAVLRKASGWESYTITVEEKPGPGTPGALEAKYRKGQPLACKADRIDLFKRGDTVVYREGDRWVKSRRGRLSDPL